MLLCFLWRNVETSCHKHFAVVSRYQQAPPLTTSDKCHKSQLAGPWSGGAMLITPGRSQCWQHAVKPALLAQNRDLCLPRLHSTPPLGGGRFPSEYYHDVWYGKLEWCSYTRWLKILNICLFVSTECTIVTNGQIDRHRMTAMATLTLHRATKRVNKT